MMMAPSDYSGQRSTSGKRKSEGPRFVARNEHERIQAVVAQVIARVGYAQTSVEEICAEAHIAPETFYAHFSGKQEAAMSALEAGVDQVMLACRNAFSSARTWPEAIWATFAVYTEWCANEPAFARLAIVEMLVAGPAGLDLLQSLAETFGMFLKPGHELLSAQAQQESRLIDENVANGVFGLLHEHLEREPPETLPSVLPELVRIILTPFLGIDAARGFVERRRARSD